MKNERYRISNHVILFMLISMNTSQESNPLSGME